jgi:hypothetical protein
MHKEMVVLGKWREVKDYGWLEGPKMVQERDVWTASTRSDGEMVGEQEAATGVCPANQYV